MCLDQPGCGIHWQKRSPWLIRDTVEFLRSEYLATKPKENVRCHILGLSLGGMIAVAWADSYPDDFYGGVLMNTSMPKVSRPFDRIRWQVLLSGVWSFLSGDSLYRREKRLLDLVSNDPKVREELLPSWTAIQKARPVSSANFLRMLFSATTFRTPGISPFSRTLILKSCKDHLINSRCSDQLASWWGSEGLQKIELYEHESAGHDLSSDDPDWVANRLQEWRNSWSKKAK